MLSISRKSAGLAAATCAAALLLGSGTANAQTVTGWVGATPPQDSGVVYLHNSSVSNDSGIVARTKLYTATGATAQPNFLGVRARLFKSGALCDVAGYQFNPTAVPSLEVSTTADCGPGSYNSHGFVKINTQNSGTKEYVTFPSNPINYTGAPTARSARSADQAQPPTTTVTKGGKTFGPYKSESSAPDYIAAYTDSGQLGFVAKSDLAAATKAGTQLKIVSDTGSQIGALTVK